MLVVVYEAMKRYLAPLLSLVLLAGQMPVFATSNAHSYVAETPAVEPGEVHAMAHHGEHASLPELHHPVADGGLAPTDHHPAQECAADCDCCLFGCHSQIVTTSLELPVAHAMPPYSAPIPTVLEVELEHPFRPPIFA